METKIGCQVQTHIPSNVAYWFVADLPKHNGLTPIKGSNSDWGWTTDRNKAIPLTAYWQRRFLAHCRRDANRPSFGVQ